MEAKSDRSSSLVGFASTDGSFSARSPRWTSSVASPPSSRIMFGPAVGPLEDAVGVVPVLVQGLTLVREDGHAAGGDGRRGMILGREDVARGPAHLGAQRLQGLDQHGGLDGHVERAGDAGPLSGCCAAYSSRIAMRAGISVSAMAISFRPHSAREVGDLEVGSVLVGLLGGGAHHALLSVKAKKFVSAVSANRPSLAGAGRPLQRSSGRPS